MLKRAFWFTTGATAGFGGAMWVRRQVLQAVHRYTPERVQADVTSSVRRLGSDLRGGGHDRPGGDGRARVRAAVRAAPRGGAGARPRGPGDRPRPRHGPEGAGRRESDHRRTHAASLVVASGCDVHH